MWTGATLGVTPALSALCAPLWGRVGDRFGNKLLVQRALLSCVVVMALMSRATEAWHLFALRAILGLLAGYGSLTLTMAALSAPREKMASAIGSVQTAQRVGPAIGPLLGGLLESALGLRTTFLVSSCVYAVAFVMVSVMYVEPAKAAAPDRNEERVSFSNVLAFENFVVLMLVIFSLQVVDRSFGPVLLLHVTELGYTARGASLLVGGLFSALALSGVAGFQLAAILLKRTTARAVIVTASLAAAASLATFALVESAWLLMVTIALFGSGRRHRPHDRIHRRRLSGPASCAWGRVRVSDRRLAHWLGNQSDIERADCRAQHSRGLSVRRCCAHAARPAGAPGHGRARFTRGISAFGG